MSRRQRPEVEEDIKVRLKNAQAAALESPTVPFIRLLQAQNLVFIWWETFADELPNHLTIESLEQLWVIIAQEGIRLDRMDKQALLEHFFRE